MPVLQLAHICPFLPNLRSAQTATPERCEDVRAVRRSGGQHGAENVIRPAPRLDVSRCMQPKTVVGCVPTPRSPQRGENEGQRASGAHRKAPGRVCEFRVRRGILATGLCAVARAPRVCPVCGCAVWAAGESGVPGHLHWARGGRWHTRLVGRQHPLAAWVAAVRSPRVSRDGAVSDGAAS
eukprot:542505-Prymnesium_polylepis.1